MRSQYDSSASRAICNTREDFTQASLLLQPQGVLSNFRDSLGYGSCYSTHKGKAFLVKYCGDTAYKPWLHDIA